MKVHFITLGCKTNQYETNAMEQSFSKKGYRIVNSENELADVYVINTCSVTNIAERKSRQMLRKAKELNPNAIIVACGCYAQVSEKTIENMNEVDIVIGINEKNNIVSIVEKYLEENKKQIDITDVMHQNTYKEFENTVYIERQNRSVIKIQDGCDRFCTYCIIPYARGKVRSRNPESILNEIEKVVAEGVKEVVLTGIHIASYGKDFSKETVEEYRKKYNYKDSYIEFNSQEDLSTGGFRLIELLEQINNIEGIKRIRLGSLEPKLITNEFVNRLSKLEKVCNHFHLSLQSGCDETLVRMNRRYNTKEFEKSVKTLRNNFENVSLTTDVIVGFPGETDEEFKKTYEFLSKIKFYKMHIFKHSPKKGTKAEKMPNQIDGIIKEQRSQQLIELSNLNEEQYNKNYIGKVFEVLFEERCGNYLKGHTTNYLMINVKTDENLENEIRKVKIIATDGLEIFGQIEI